jgi:hypothetical protein
MIAKDIEEAMNKYPLLAWEFLEIQRIIDQQKAKGEIDATTLKPKKKRGKDADWGIEEFGGYGVKDATALLFKLRTKKDLILDERMSDFHTDDVKISFWEKKSKLTIKKR